MKITSLTASDASTIEVGCFNLGLQESVQNFKDYAKECGIEIAEEKAGESRHKVPYVRITIKRPRDNDAFWKFLGKYVDFGDVHCDIPTEYYFEEKELPNDTYYKTNTYFD